MSPRILNEPTAESPLWLEVAGYPKYLNTKVRREAWTVFKKMVETDCAQNARPDTFTISVNALAEAVGLDPPIVERVIKGFHKRKMIRCYLPDHAEEEGMFQFLLPMEPPMDVEEIRQRLAALEVQKVEHLRYLDDRVLPDAAADNRVSLVVDAYINTFGARVNSFVLDELTLIAGRFRLEHIRDAFARAAQTQSPLLRDVIRDLVILKEKTKEASGQMS